MEDKNALKESAAGSDDVIDQLLSQIQEAIHIFFFTDPLIGFQSDNLPAF